MSILETLPIWVVYLLTVGVVLLVAEIGFRFGVWLQRRDPSLLKGRVTGAVVAGMLSLLAFLLAFSIGLALNMFSARRQLVTAEANAIAISYLRAGFLGEPDGAAARDLLREYVDLRLATLDPDPAQLEEVIRRSEEIHKQLWSIVERQAGENPDSEFIPLFVDSVSEVIEVHSRRAVAVVSLRIPWLVWLVFYGIAVLSFFVLGLVSSADGKRNLFGLVLFALALAAVLVLMVDLNRSQAGVVRVGQKALFDLQRIFEAPVP